ncbi:MAG TPA: peroxiredoxin [Polyangiales bacterium]
MLKVGETAPSFTAMTTNGDAFALRRLLGAPVILYFFHKAFTPNCTIETKGFRDNYDELRELGYALVGISTDSHETQCKFAQRHGVSYPMIGDEDHAIARAYDVMWPLIPVARRVAYVLDANHVITAVFRHEFQANRHLDEVMRHARELRAARNKSMAPAR